MRSTAVVRLLSNHDGKRDGFTSFGDKSVDKRLLNLQNVLGRQRLSCCLVCEH